MYLPWIFTLLRSQCELKNILPCLHSNRVGGQGCFFSVWGQRCSIPTERSCFHPWILSIIDRTPTASQAGIAWKKLGKPATVLLVPELHTGDRAPLGRQLAPAFYSRLLGVTVWRHAQSPTHTHTLTGSSGELLTYSPNHFIDLWAKDVKAYWGHH